MSDIIKKSRGELPQRPEIAATPKTSPETAREGGAVELRTEDTSARPIQEQEQVAEIPPVVSQAQSSPLPSEPKSTIRKEIEEILAQDLGELYKTLTPQQRTLFKLEGEKAAARIEEQVAKPRVKIKEILHIIREWLKLLPGVNKFFIEKEVKIKTERILMIKKESED